MIKIAPSEVIKGSGPFSRRDGDARHKEALVNLLRLILSVLVPPLGVFLQVGFGWHLLLNVLLTALGYFPGLVHAVWIIFAKE